MRFVGLSRKPCACGFDLATQDPARAIELARRDQRKALLLVALGCAALAVIVVVNVVPALDAVWTRWSAPTAGLPVRVMRVSTAVLLVTVATAIYAPGRGSWLAFDARRRLRRLRELAALPSARVISS
jgi:hypothetical protein